MNQRTFGLRWLLVPLGGALAAGAIAISGSLISAQTPIPTTTDEPRLYDDILADELGIDIGGLRDAQANARERYLDQLVDSGDLTAAEAADLKASSPGEIAAGALARSDLDLVRDFILTQIASVLDIDREQLDQDLKDGKTFDKIAEKNGLTDQDVRETLRSRIDQLIDFAVDAGFVSEEDAAGLKANAGEILDIVFETSGANADSTPTP